MKRATRMGKRIKWKRRMGSWIRSMWMVRRIRTRRRTDRIRRKGEEDCTRRTIRMRRHVNLAGWLVVWLAGLLVG